MLTKLHAFLTLNKIRFLKQTEFYQPTVLPAFYLLWPVNNIKRGSSDRFDFIFRNLPTKKLQTLLDVGCQIGYFSISFAKKGFVVTGIDSDNRAIEYASSLSNLNHLTNTRFEIMILDKTTVQKIIKYDVILFMNVFHHIASHQGFDSAKEVLDKLSKQCRYLIFEAPTTNELGHSWSQALTPMGNNSNLWMKHFLTKDLKLEIVAQKDFPIHLSHHLRTVYILRS